MAVTPPTPAPDAPRRSLTWLWITIPVVVVLIGAMVAAALVVPALIGQTQSSSSSQRDDDDDDEDAEEEVEGVIHEFNRAFEKQDCDLVQELMTEEAFSELFQTDGFDCEAFEADAASLVNDEGDYTFEVEIVSIAVNGDTARVKADETWWVGPERFESESSYHLERERKGWIITSYKLDPVLVETDVRGPSTDDDADLQADLVNAKVAMVARTIDMGASSASVADLENYGFVASVPTDNMMIITTTEGYCIENTSMVTGFTYSVTNAEGVIRASCFERGF